MTQDDIKAIAANHKVSPEQVAAMYPSDKPVTPQISPPDKGAKKEKKKAE